MEKPNLSFDQLPQLIHDQGRQIEELTKLVLQALADKSEQEPDVPNMNIHEAAEFLNLKVATVYSKVSKGEIPCMKRGNRLYFSKMDLIEYLHAGRRKTDAEISKAAEMYLSGHTKSAISK